jgi:RNA polymerase sigma-70 factor (ECF subfamily)
VIFLDDSGIIDLFLRRDEDAIAETSNKYGKKLHSFSYGIVSSDEDADECVNDTYLSAWGLIPPNEPRTYYYPFLLRIIRHISFNCLKKKNRQKRSAVMVELTDELGDCLISEMEEQGITEAINHFLLGISPDARIVFVKRYFYMDSISDIAQNCGFSVSKVTSMLFRTRKALRKYLEGRNITI